MSQLVFLGAPGSGKGTQAKRLAKEKGHVHLSTGDLLREEVAKNTALGEKIDAILKKGDLVDDLTVMELLTANCHLDKSDYIFDGFPRNEAQARLLEERLLKDRPYRGVYFKVPLETLVGRLAQRRVCQKCGAIYNVKSMPPRNPGACDHCGSGHLFQRDDDREGVIANRFNVYTEMVGPILDRYRSRGILVELAADKGSEEVFGELLRRLFGD
ncbi:MAG: nucleoside monophosphate kinase [Bacteriovoracales bacterium]|nr:nucleoside monophosphate kinase [Bacteriovoracales bacterium]